ncbi:hypothetical protein FHT00_000750 [Sphingomonas insulae]|uniref:Uncharacterized protein n=1 Tax=Sphingomonas insulae TaxID=424800 RepID=A0ABN1HZA9_9SPHN|nr:hypothetical protein [Sphingomonas insulae]NIJ28822.1 hypothetical protein [Sphingomonas insulae]
MPVFTHAATPSEPIQRNGPEERDYLLKRAADHQQLAAIAHDNLSRDIHGRLRHLYEERAAAITLAQQD